MSGALWAVAAGIGFGLFQSVNRRAIGTIDVYRSTFLQLLVSTTVLVLITAASQDIGIVWSAPGRAVGYFAVAGLIHFFVGWTLLNASQERIGAARTSPLLATTPLFGTLIAALTLGEVPGVSLLAGLLLMVAGVYLVGGEQASLALEAAAGGAGADPVAAESGIPAGARNALRLARGRTTLAASTFGLAAALSMATSPIFIRKGLESLPSPLVGVTISMVAAAAAYGLALVIRRPAVPSGQSLEGLAFKAVAGVLVGFATWFRWIALERTPVALVLALALLSVPTVLVVAPALSGRHLERVTARLWGGAGLVVGGALLLILW